MFHWDSNKNCPFCDGEPEITQAIENDQTSLVATCPDDDCVGSTIRCSIDLWNTRATPTKLDDPRYPNTHHCACRFDDETDEQVLFCGRHTVERIEGLEQAVTRFEFDFANVTEKEFETLQIAARAYLKLQEQK